MLGECFDPNGELLISERCRPHWLQARAVVFITFRTYDSIPREVIDRWEREKKMAAATRLGSRRALVCDRRNAPRKGSGCLSEMFVRCRENFLDTCHGRCLLRRPELARIVADSLLHFDGQRYRMGDFIVMPNHVHLLAAFPTPEAMKGQCESWLHYTAFQINQVIHEKGKFWQQEPFDHLVRNPNQYEYLRRYIAENPLKAGLKSGQYYYRRFRRMTNRGTLFRGAKGDTRRPPDVGAPSVAKVITPILRTRPLSPFAPRKSVFCLYS